MARKAKHAKLKVLALAGAGFVFLVADLLLLALVVMPLAASTRQTSSNPSASATEGAELALLLPTRDPRTPWPTSTPSPTATPWLIFPSTLARAATAAVPHGVATPLMSTSAPDSDLAPSSLASDTPQPAKTTAVLGSTPTPTASSPSPKTSAAALVTTPTATQEPAAAPAVPPSSNLRGSPSETPGSSATSVANPTETPTTAPDEETPTATPSPTPPPTPPLTLDDLPDFETFLRTSRNAIAGQEFNIVSLGVDRTDATLPRFVLEVAGGEEGSVFGLQPATDLTDYGRGFLEDAQRYLGGAYCAVAVESTYQTSDSGICSSAPDWCRLGAQDPTTNTWDVTWTYVRGSFTDGSYAIEAWNTGQ